MARLTSLFLLVAMFSNAYAIVSQQESIQASVSEVTTLVNVSGSLDFPSVLPGHDYSKTVSIKWSVPNAALQDILSERVTIFVKVSPKTPTSWIYFTHEGKNYKELVLNLSCLVSRGSCLQDSSVLEQTVEARLDVPFDATFPHSDGAVVTASLLPFNASSEEYVTQEEALTQASQELNAIEQQITQSRAKGADATEAENLVSDAANFLEKKDLQNASKKLDEAKALLQKLSDYATPTPPPTQTQANALNGITGLLAAREAPVFLALIFAIALLGYLIYQYRQKKKK